MELQLIILNFIFVIIGGIDVTWWKHTTVYEVMLSTFKDSNGDGIGDIKGLISKLDHLVEIGVGIIYITPHYESPMHDGGYDVSNFTSVRASLGTMADFEELSLQAKRKGDVIACSDQHPWFIKSINKEFPYKDYYVWRNAKCFDDKGNPIPPNNWMSLFGGSIWKWNKKRKQFYLHQFFEQQPDFNLRNQLVIEEIKFWMDKGVMGFRLDASRYLMEDDQFKDEPLSSTCTTGKVMKYSDLNHIYTLDLDEIYPLIHEIREYVDEYSIKLDDFERILAPEAYAPYETVNLYFDRENYKVSHLPFNFALVQIYNYENATFYDNLITTYLNGLPNGAKPSWNVENHDNLRKAQVFCEEYEQIMLTWIMLLPGVAYLYYGQEIGMTGARMRRDQELDNLSHVFPRDPARLPMQWDNSINAGFTSKLLPLLPTSPNYWRINLKTLKRQKNSRYYFFKTLSTLRKTNTIKFGSLKSYILSTWVWAFTRILEGQHMYLVLSNLGSETEILNLSIIDNLPEVMRVEVAGMNSGFIRGDMVQMFNYVPKLISLRPLSVVVFSSKVDLQKNKC